MASANARLAGLAAWVDDFIESVATFCNTARVHQPTWRLGRFSVRATWVQVILKPDLVYSV